MLYRRLIINGTEYMLAVSQSGSGAPKETTEGAAGVLYMDTDDGSLYKCTGEADGKYTWEPMETGNGPGQNGNGGGLTAEEKSLMLSLFNNALYGADVGAIKDRLNALWGGESGGDSGDDSGGGESGGGDSGDSTLYTISTDFVNVSIDNTATSATANSEYTATLTATTGELASVTITMGGVDVTADVYADGVITIPAVTGNILIFASATAFIDLLAENDIAFVNVTGDQYGKGMGYGLVSNSKLTLSAGTYYFYSVYKTNSGVPPKLYKESDDGTFTDITADIATISNKNTYWTGAYNEYGSEDKDYYKPNSTGYFLEKTIVLSEDFSGYMHLGASSQCYVNSEPGYTYLFTTPYNPHLDTLAQGED